MSSTLSDFHDHLCQLHPHSNTNYSVWTLFEIVNIYLIPYTAQKTTLLMMNIYNTNTLISNLPTNWIIKFGPNGCMEFTNPQMKHVIIVQTERTKGIGNICVHNLNHDALTYCNNNFWIQTTFLQVIMYISSDDKNILTSVEKLVDTGDLILCFCHTHYISAKKVSN